LANTVSLKIKIDDDGSLSIVAKEATKAKKAVEGVDKATTKAAKSSDNYSKKNKGVAQAGMNTTKSFSKMTTGITGGLVPAYATLAANVFALSAAFNFFKRAADVSILEKSQTQYAGSTGVALKSITAGLREASGGMLGFREAAEAAAIGVAKGFSPQQLEDLAAGAKRAAAALGRGFEDAFDRLIRGASKAEPELLDELGITLRLDTATKNYAKTLGVQQNALTATQRSQAVLIETQKQLNELFGTAPAESNPFVVLSKTFEDLVRAGTDFLMPMLTGIASIVNKSGVAAIAVFGLLAVSIFKAMVPLDGIKSRIKDMQVASAESTAHAINDQMKYREELKKNADAIERAKISASQKSAKAAVAAGGGKSKLVNRLAGGEKLNAIQAGRVKKMLKEAEQQYKDHGEIVKGTFKGMDIAIVKDMKVSMNDMTKSSRSFGRKTIDTFKKVRLGGKVAFSKLKQIGTSTLGGLGKLAEKTGKLMSKALKMAGVIGVFVMLYELGMKLIRSPFSIIHTFLQGLDTVVNNILSMLSPVLGTVGGLIDGVKNKWAGFVNYFIEAYNVVARTAVGKSMGMSEMDLMNEKNTSARESLEKLGKEGVNTAKLFADSPIGARAFAEELKQDKIAAQKDNLKSFGETFEKMGDDLEAASKTMTSSLNKQTDAQKGFTQANFVGTLGLGARIGAIYETSQALDALGNAYEYPTLTAVQQETALADLRREMTQLGVMSPKLAKLLAKNPLSLTDTGETDEEGNLLTNLDLINRIGANARSAGAELKTMRDAASGVTSAMVSGDLKSAEYLLNDMEISANAAAAAYLKLGTKEGIASANQALEEFNSALGDNINTTDYKNKLIELREAQGALSISMITANNLAGQAGELTKIQNEQLTHKLALDEIDLKLIGLKSGALFDELNLLKNITEEKEKQAKYKQIEATQGEGMAVAARTGDIAAVEQAKLDEKGDKATFGDKATALMNTLSPMQEQLANMGPDGALISAALDGAFMMSTAFTGAFKTIGDSGASSGDRIKAGLEIAAGAMQAIGGILAASSKAQIAEIDQQIEAEKKRDGKSAGSVAKMAALEKKKEAAKKKAFEVNKKMSLAQTAIATATAVMETMKKGGFFASPLAMAVAAMGAVQMALIAGTSYQGGGSAGGASAPTAVSVGKRDNTVDLAKGNSASGELGYMRGERGQGTGATNFKPGSAFTGAKYRASGGETAGFMVGEQGPELFIPDRSGRIAPADETASMGATSNVNFNISAVDAAGVEDVLVRQKGHIIRMIREAANEHGQPFLEDISDGSYTS
jgi:hypothetical protein